MSLFDSNVKKPKNHVLSLHHTSSGNFSGLVLEPLWSAGVF